MIKKITLVEYPNSYWHVADVIVDDAHERTFFKINKFYDVKKDYIIEYEATGGSGIGFKPGKVIRKIFIGDAEFETIQINLYGTENHISK